MWGSGGKYADWAAFLETWGRREVGVEAIPGELQPADFDVATWERLVTRVQNAIEARSKLWAASLQSDLGLSSDEFTMGRALTRARHGVDSIRALTEIPGLPADLRSQLGEQIERSVRSWQQALEDDAHRLRAMGQTQVAETFLRAVRENALLGGQSSRLPREGGDPWAASTSSGRRTVNPD